LKFAAIIAAFRQFRSRSVLIKVLISMFTFGVILSVAALLLFTALLHRDLKAEQEIMNQSVVNLVANEFEMIIKNGGSLATQLSYSKGVVANVYSTTVNKRVLTNAEQELAALCQHSILIDEAYLFVPRHGTVASSDFLSGEIEESSLAPLYEEYTANRDSYVKFDCDGKETTLVCFEGSLYIFRDFPLCGNRRLAVIALKIDKDELFLELSRSLQPGDELHIYDNQGVEVSKDDLRYAKQDTGKSSAGKQYETYTSKLNITDYHVAITMDMSDAKISIFGTFVTMLPLLLVFVFVVSLASVPISMRIYSPMYELHTEALGKSDENIMDYTNEVDFIGKSLTSLYTAKTQMETALNTVSDVVLEKVFTQIIRLGYSPERDESIKQAMSSIKSEFRLDSWYMVVVIDFAETATKRTDEILDDMVNAVDTSCLDQCRMFPLVFDGKCVLICSAPSELDSGTAGKQFVESLRPYYAWLYTNMQSFKCGVSRIGKSIHTIRDAYLEACDGLESAGAAMPLRNARPMHGEIETLGSEIARVALRSGYKAAFVLVEEGVNTAAARSEGAAESFYLSCKQLVASIIVELSKHQTVKTKYHNDMLFINQKHIEEVSISEIKELTIRNCDTILQDFTQEHSKQQNKYLIAAKNYIADHYDDVTLSLTSVSEIVEVSPSYLSRLFKSILGVSFTDYLSKYRVTQSLSLLAQTDDKISDIAEKCGFSSVQNYIRVFNKYMEQTPGKFRSNCRK